MAVKMRKDYTGDVQTFDYNLDNTFLLLDFYQDKLISESIIT